MAVVVVRMNGGSKLTLGTGTPVPAEQQLHTIEIPNNTPTSDVATYGGASTITGQPKRILHLAGYQDWGVVGSVCDYLEDNAGQWREFSFDQYGGGAASTENPIVNAEVLCIPPVRGGKVDNPEEFDLQLGIRGYTVDKGTP